MTMDMCVNVIGFDNIFLSSAKCDGRGNRGSVKSENSMDVMICISIIE